MVQVDCPKKRDGYAGDLGDGLFEELQIFPMISTPAVCVSP